MRLPYRIEHLLAACLLSVVFMTPVAGVLFYLGREIRDREKLGRWDWPGLLWPVVPLAPLLAFEWWIKFAVLFDVLR